MKHSTGPCKLQKIRVFMSHNWGKNASVHSKVKMISEVLSGHPEIEVWFDETHMKGNIPLAMANGIDSSDVFLVFVTAEYMDKVASGKHQDNVFREFNYAQETMGQNRLIPIKFDNVQRKWWGPVGMILGSTLYVDMSKDTIPPSSYEMLISSIKSCGVRPQKLLSGAINKVMDFNRAIKFNVANNNKNDNDCAGQGGEEVFTNARTEKPSMRHRTMAIAQELVINEDAHMRDIIERAMETLKVTQTPGMMFHDKIAAIEKHLSL